MTGTIKEICAALTMLRCVADTIKELGEAPSRYLYAALMPTGVTLDGFEKIVATLERANLITKRGDVLVWKGGMQTLL